MDRLSQLRAAAGGSRDSTLDTTSPPSEAYTTANESSSKYFSLSEVDTTFDISSMKDVSLATATADSDENVTNTEELISNLSPISKESYKIGKQIEAANILSGGVDIFEDNSYDGDELVIDDNAEDDKSNPEMKSLSLQGNMESTLIDEEADIASKDTEVVLQIDGKNVDAIDIGNGLYLYRKEGEEELAAVQIIDDDQHQPSFKFLKVRENAEGNLEVYEEIEIEVPKEVPPKEGKTGSKPSHVPIKDINKVISESACNKVFEKKSPSKEPASTSIDVEANVNKDPTVENKSDVNFNGKMKKFSESRKSPVIGSFTPMTYHSTPNKEGKPLTKTMVDLQLHPSRHSDNVKKTIEVHTDSCKQRLSETPVKNKDSEDSKTTEISNYEKENVLEENMNNTLNIEIKEQNKVDNDASEGVDITINKHDNNMKSSSDKISSSDTVAKVSLDERKDPKVHVDAEVKDSTVLEDKCNKHSEAVWNDGTIRDTNPTMDDKKSEAVQFTESENIKDNKEKRMETTDICTNIKTSYAKSAEVPDKIKVTTNISNESIEKINETNISESAIIRNEKRDNKPSLKTSSSAHNEIKEITEVKPADDIVQNEHITESKNVSTREVDRKPSEPDPILVRNVLTDSDKETIVQQSPKSGFVSNNLSSEKLLVKSNDITDTKIKILEDSKSLEQSIESSKVEKQAAVSLVSENNKNVQDKKKEAVKDEINNIKHQQMKPDNSLVMYSEAEACEDSNVKKCTIENTVTEDQSCKVASKAEKDIKHNPKEIKILQNTKFIPPIHEMFSKKTNVAPLLPIKNADAIVINTNLEPKKVPKIENLKVASTSIDSKQEISSFSDKTIRDQGIKSKIEPIDKKDVSKINIETKLINNNHTAVPFGQWTEANRQEFLNKFKSKVPTASANGNQIKNSNDLNRRDVLKKIDSQRQSSNALSKVQEANKLNMKSETAFGKTNLVTQESKIPVKSEAPELKVKLVPDKNITKPEIKQGSPNKTQLAVGDSVPKKESKQRTEVNYQDLIDKTIEGMLHRVAPGKVVQDESKTKSEKEPSSLTNTSSYPQNYPPIDEIATLDAIEMKMNELHGIPFIERPAHELPKVLKSDLNNYPISDTEKPTATIKTNIIPNLLPVAYQNQQKTVKDNPADVDSEEEIIEHEPVTGDIELSKKTLVPKPSSCEKLALSSSTDKTPADSSIKDPIITEKDFDKFARRNSITYENRITVNFESKETNNVVQTVVQKDLGPTNIPKSNWHVENKSKAQLNQNIRKHEPKSIIPHKLHGTNKFETASDETSSRNQSKVQKAYQSALTAKRQMEYPITIIEDKPVKVVYMDTMEFAPSQLNVQGKDLSPAKNLTNESDAVTTGTCDSLDSDFLDNINDNKSQEESKVKTKHQRKQVLTPVQEPELELIEPRDLGIELPNKKKRKTEDDKADKNMKYPMRKKYYLLGSSTVEEKPHNIQEITKNPLTENRNENMHTHQSHVSAIDNLVKAAELIETQSENAMNVTNPNLDSQQSTPVKRGRGRPRKYPLPEGVSDKSKVPNPQKKPRLIDAKPIKHDAITDDEDSDGEIVKENWTMGKINENIVCPICNKLFRTENVVFKHVKHCTGPSPNRSDSDKRSPRRSRQSQESDESKSHESQSEDMDAEDDKPLRKKEDKETSKQRKSKDSLSKPDGDKDDIIVIEDTPDKERPKNIDNRKQHESRKQKSKLPRKNTDLVCEFCGKTFRQLSYLVNHKQQHKKDDSKRPQKEVPVANKSVFICEVCKKEFRKLHHLVQHRIIHNPNSMPVRSLRKSSSEQSESKSEKISISSKQSEDTSAGFRCEPCDKSFRKLHHLVEHRETHDGINRQKNTSVTQNNIEKTVLVHACDVCKKTFRKLHHLIEHKEQHMDTGSEKSDDKSIKSSLSTKDIIHECSLCYMVFPNEHSLTKHTIICQRKKRQSKQKKEEGTETTEETSENLKSEEKVDDGTKSPIQSDENVYTDTDIKNNLEKEKVFDKTSYSNEIENADKNIEIEKSPPIERNELEVRGSEPHETIIPTSGVKRESLNSDKEEILMSEKIKKVVQVQENIEVIKVPEKVKKVVDMLEKAKKIVQVPEKIKNISEASEKIKKDSSEVPEKINNVPERIKNVSEVPKKIKNISEIPEKIKKISEVPGKIKKVYDVSEKNKHTSGVPEKIKKVLEVPVKTKNVSEVPEKTKKVTEKDIVKINNTPKKKAPIKDKITVAAIKRAKTSTEPIPVAEDTKPAVESSDDDEIRYMLNPDFKAEETVEKVFMIVRSQKRNSFQIERPSSKDLVKRRISLQHPPKIPRIKQKPNENNATLRHAFKTTKLESVPSTDSDDSDVVKYSFPKTVPDKIVKPVRDIPKESERKPPRKTIAEKRKSLSSIAKRKSVGKAVVSRKKPSPVKQIKRRTLGIEHRCDCGQLFSSAALLARHASLAHTPPRRGRRREPSPPPPPHPPHTPQGKSTLQTDPKHAASRKSSVRSDAGKPADGDKTLGQKKLDKSVAKSTGNPKRTSAHRGVPVPEKMRKLMQKNK